MVNPELRGDVVSGPQSRPVYSYPPVGDAEADAGDDLVVESNRPVSDRISMHTVDVESMPDEVLVERFAEQDAQQRAIEAGDDPAEVLARE